MGFNSGFKGLITIRGIWNCVC